MERDDGDHDVGERKRVSPPIFKAHKYVVFVKARRVQLGMTTQKSFSERTGVSEPQISSIENGKQDPRSITNWIHEAFAEVLETPMGVLIELAGYNLGKYLDRIEELRYAGIAAQIELVTDLSNLAQLPEPEFRALLEVALRHRASRR